MIKFIHNFRFQIKKIIFFIYQKEILLRKKRTDINYKKMNLQAQVIKFKNLILNIHIKMRHKNSPLTVNMIILNY